MGTGFLTQKARTPGPWRIAAIVAITVVLIVICLLLVSVSGCRLALNRENAAVFL